MQGVVKYVNEMHDFTIHRHGDVTRAIAVEADFLPDMSTHSATHHPTTCTGTIEEILQAAALVEQGDGLHVKQ